jgi:hypothetical protein
MFFYSSVCGVMTVRCTSYYWVVDPSKIIALLLALESPFKIESLNSHTPPCVLAFSTTSKRGGGGRGTIELGDYRVGFRFPNNEIHTTRLAACGRHSSLQCLIAIFQL